MSLPPYPYQPYFIFALPRSRTAWLANFLTYDNSFCYHDGLRHCGQVSDLRDLFDHAFHGLHGAAHVGDSDSALPLFWRGLREHFPTAKALFVYRHSEQCLADYLAFAGREPYPGQPPATAPQVRAAFARLNDALDEAAAEWPSDLQESVNFEDLDHVSHCRRIWNFLVPTTFFNERRWEQLHVMRLNPLPAKIHIDWPRVARLMATIPNTQPATRNTQHLCLSEP